MNLTSTSKKVISAALLTSGVALAAVAAVGQSQAPEDPRHDSRGCAHHDGRLERGGYDPHDRGRSRGRDEFGPPPRGDFERGSDRRGYGPPPPPRPRDEYNSGGGRDHFGPPPRQRHGFRDEYDSHAPPPREQYGSRDGFGGHRPPPPPPEYRGRDHRDWEEGFGPHGRPQRDEYQRSDRFRPYGPPPRHETYGAPAPRPAFEDLDVDGDGMLSREEAEVIWETPRRERRGHPTPDLPQGKAPATDAGEEGRE